MGVDPSIGTEQGFDRPTARVGRLVEKDATATAGMASTKSGRCRPDPIDELLVTCRVAADAEARNGTTFGASESCRSSALRLV